MILERAARILALAGLALLLSRELRPAPKEQVNPARIGVEDLPVTLRAATLDVRHQAGMVVRVDSVPTPAERDWLAALRTAGTPVAWSMGMIDPVVVVAEPIADPRGGVDVRVWRGGAHPAVITDGAGELARMEPSAGMSGVLARAVVRDVEVHLPGQHARAAAPDSLRLGAVLVVGRAGWEARFLLRSLEELGWSAHARLSVAPGVAVTQGQPATPDTARYAVVVVLDSTATREATTLQRYVGSGGGLVLVGEGTRIGALAVLAPGGSGRREGGADEPLPRDLSRLGLALYPIQPTHAEAVVLEQHGERPVVAARRVGSGRVVQVGYDESWRLRMEGGEAGPEVHREWWARLLAAAAYAPGTRSLPAASLAEPAPVAALIDAIGPPSAVAADPPRSSPLRLPSRYLFLAVALLLMVEWASRRLRGAR